MNAYTVSRLAKEAGFTVHVVRNYTERGLLQASRRTASGYRIYDEQALDRLRLIQAGKKAGVPLGQLEQICHALDEHDGGRLGRCVAAVRTRIADTRAALAVFEAALKPLGAAPGPPARAGKPATISGTQPKQAIPERDSFRR